MGRAMCIYLKASMCMLRRAAGSPPCSACVLAVTHNLTPVVATSQSTPDLVSCSGSILRLSSFEGRVPSGLSGLIIGVLAPLEGAVETKPWLCFSFVCSTHESVYAFLRELEPRWRTTAFAERRRDVNTGIRDRTMEGIMVYRVDWQISSQGRDVAPTRLLLGLESVIVSPGLRRGVLGLGHEISHGVTIPQRRLRATTG